MTGFKLQIYGAGIDRSITAPCVTFVTFDIFSSI